MNWTIAFFLMLWLVKGVMKISLLHKISSWRICILIRGNRNNSLAAFDLMAVETLLQTFRTFSIVSAQRANRRDCHRDMWSSSCAGICQSRRLLGNGRVRSQGIFLLYWICFCHGHYSESYLIVHFTTKREFSHWYFKTLEHETRLNKYVYICIF
jgi:hypothetical protein